MNEWRSCKLRMALYAEVAYAVEHLRNRNMQKYDSIGEFVEKACVDLLEKEKVDYKKVKEITN